MTADAAGERVVLEAERDRLLHDIREVDAEHAAGDLSDDEHASLRDGYTAQAASVIRRLEILGPAVDDRPVPVAAEAPVEEDPPARRRSRRRMRVLVAAAGVVVVGVGAGLLVAGSTGSRGTGQSVSGNVPLAPAQELVAAQHAMATGDDITALKLYQAVLHVEPNQPQALAYTGWLLREAGDEQGNSQLIAQAITAEETAVHDDPEYPDARYFLGVMLLDEADDPSGAVVQLKAYLATHPPASAAKAVEPVLARAESEAKEAPTTTTTRPPAG